MLRYLHKMEQSKQSVLENDELSTTTKRKKEREKRQDRQNTKECLSRVHTPL
jgi:hypothetical protein